MVVEMKNDLTGTGAVVDLDAEVVSPIAQHFGDFLDSIRELGAHIGGTR